jgi:hypothetical protein
VCFREDQLGICTDGVGGRGGGGGVGRRRRKRDGDVVENERCGRVVTPCIVELMNVGVWIVGGRHGCQL